MPLQTLLAAKPLLSGLAGGAAVSMFSPFGNVAGYTANQAFPTTMPDVQTIIRLLWTDPDNQDHYIGMLRNLGYREEIRGDLVRSGIRFPTISEILQLYLLGFVDKDKGFQVQGKDGTLREYTVDSLFRSAQVPPEMNDWYLRLAQRPLPLESTVRLLRRFGDYVDGEDVNGNKTFSLIPEGGELTDHFKASKRAEGLDHVDEELIFKAFGVYPGVQDIIRFMVREVFTPEIADEFGIFEELPDKGIEEGRKAGITPEWMKNFWGSHWELPSIGQGFEMFQRGVITQDELNLLLRAKDVMPFWRGKLTEISYRRTRLVDIMRLYEQRVIPKIDPSNLNRETPLVKEYMHRGYNEKRAIDLAVWTDRVRQDPATESTIKAATEAFVEGIISEAELSSVLDELDIAPDNKEFIIAGEKVKRETQELKQTIKRYAPLLLDGRISEQEFLNKLSEFGLSAQSMKNIIDDVEAERASKAKGLTTAEALRLYKGGDIKNPAEVRSIIIANGKTPRATDLLLFEAKRDRDSGANSIPFDDFKGFFNKGLVTEEQFRFYLESKAFPVFAINAYVSELEPKPDIPT